MSMLVMDKVNVKDIKQAQAEKKEYCKQQALERLGETRLNTLGSKMFIVNYTSSSNIDVQFVENGYITKTTYQNFCNGAVKNPNDKSVFGIAFVGEGNYKSTINGKITPEYISWVNMIKRATNLNFQKKNKSYIGCSVSSEWLNFQKYADFYKNNYYEIEDQVTNLDKDLLVKNNKIYSSSTCIFVPKFINNLFVTHNRQRGLYPIGVYFNKVSGKFIAQCNIGTGTQKNLGLFNTPEKAFQTYKEFKESYIKQVADEYKNKIPKKLYDAMYAYKVDIND